MKRSVSALAVLPAKRRFSVVLLASGAGALALVALIALGLPFTVGARTASARSHCAPHFPRVIRDGFPQPPMRFSSHGVLRTTLRMAAGPVRVGGGRYITDTYDGTFPGPTLVMCPGDKVTVNLVNDLGTREPSNLHVHGLHVSPRGSGDNVFIHIPWGARHTYHYAIPLDHDPGSFWYHPHLHGYVARQIFEGLSGAIVMEGGLDNLLPKIPQRLMVIQSTEFCGRNGRSLPFALSSRQRTSGTESCNLPGRAIPDADTNERFTPLFINGTLNPTVKIRPGQLQRWRIFNANNNRIVRLNLANQPMWDLAEDGNTLAHPKLLRTVMIPPGSRREILVRGASRGSYRLTALPFAQFPGGNKADLTSRNGGPTPDQTVLTVRSSGAAAHDRLPAGVLSHPVDLRRAHVNRRRNIVFSETPNPSGGTLFRLNGAVFDPNVTPVTMKLGTVEEWRLVNTSAEWHTFHIHVNPFQVVSVDGRRTRGIDYEDNVAMPPCHTEAHPADPSNPKCVSPSVVVIRMRPTDFTGRFVFHCHITNHEDRGMMMAVQVLRHPTRAQLAGSVARAPGMEIDSAPYGGAPVIAKDLHKFVVFICHLEPPAAATPAIRSPV